MFHATRAIPRHFAKAPSAICTRRSTSFLSSLKATLSFKRPKAPRPVRVEDVQVHHGKQRSDPFSWMEDVTAPALATYIQAENEYCRKFMRQYRFLHRVIVKEMKQKLRTSSVMPPLKTVSHGYEYYSTTSPYGMIYLRKPLGQGRNAPEEVLLDSGFLRTMNMTIRKVLMSPDHSIFAYNTEREGMEYGDLHFKDLQNRPQWQGEILQDVFNFVWANNETVMYTMANAQLRPSKVYAHRIGTDQAQDVLVYEEPDETAFVDITSTKDGKFVTINSNSLSSSEIRVVDASFIPRGGTTTPSMVLMQPRQPGLEYYVDHHQDTFYILTNAQGATNFKLMKAHDGALRMDQWRDVLNMQPTDKIEDVDLFQDHIVVYGRRDGLPMVLCYDIAREESHAIALPTSCCVVSPGSNLDFHTNTFRFSLTSPFSHDATYEYDMNGRKLKCIRRHDIQGIDKKYTYTQIHVDSHDGQAIPVTLIHRKDMAKNGRNPVLMRSYGAYGVNTDPDFRIEHFPLLERGWVIALAHVRGGGELGRQWYEDGRLDKKMNSFRDFVSVAAHMAQGSGISSSGRLAAMGTSAGGLLVSGMAHLAPAGLFKALVLRVPFVDPLSAMLNPSLPLTSVEVPEWGDPLQDARAYDWMAAYAPYDNAKFSKNRPAMYVTAGMKDQRVLYWQPLKFVARLRDIEAQNAKNARPPPLLLNVDLDRGHFGGQGEQDTRLNEAAEQVTFLISQLQQSI